MYRGCFGGRGFSSCRNTSVAERRAQGGEGCPVRAAGNGPEHFFEPNDLKRYSVGTKNLKNMAYNADGSLTIYVQHDSPGKDKETNWLPAPQKDFEMTIRTYWPKPEVNEGKWTPPAVVRTD